MIVTLPMPAQVTQYFPVAMVSFFQWFAFWSFAGLLTIPWLFCVYQLVTNSIGRKKRIKNALDESSAPKVVIVMPCYKEIPEVLLTAIDSVVGCDYPPSCLHVFLSFDGDQEDELYLKTLNNLGVPLILDSFPLSIDVTYRNARVTVSRFPHGGKRHCQKRTFKLIDQIYTEYLLRNDNLFILFIDSDCILDKVCIQNFVYEMELKPGSRQNMLAMTGVITSTTEKNTLITLLQDMEYIHGQLFERSVESGCGAVTCLPGALTILRFSAFRKMAKFYFADKAEQCDDLFDYGKCHLGEDRWLTHLFMIGAKERYQIQLCTGAFCKTEAVQSYRSLLKQRRRWFLGFITNEVCMLTDIRLWKKYPILCVVRFMQNTIRTTALLFFIMVLSIITTSNEITNLPIGFIAVSLGLNWALMIYFGLRLRRFKVWLYPMMFILNPFFNWLYMVYGIFTAGQRTWGGPRADAGAADTKVTVQEAIEHAESTGDDLNVVPETFKPAIQATAKHNKRPQLMPLQPSDQLEGRFAPAERLPGGWYQQAPDTVASASAVGVRDQDALDNSLLPRNHRDSFESFWTNSSADNPIPLPRRIESVMIEQDLQRYIELQAMRQELEGANENPQPAQLSGVRPQMDDNVSRAGDWIVPVEPFGIEDRLTRGGEQRSKPSGAIMQEDNFEAEPSSVAQQNGMNIADNDSSLATEHPQESPASSDRASVASRFSRMGRSPLARISRMFTASSQEPAIELQQQQEQGLMHNAPAEASDPNSALGQTQRKRNKLVKSSRKSK
ncbi:MAG: hypothetical protein M1837_000625 [Sclerophora amabilis]|nr:MAG: hypothetical protein M1837_000625 [Sclerophora amabilis]